MRAFLNFFYEGEFVGVPVVSDRRTARGSVNVMGVLNGDAPLVDFTVTCTVVLIAFL